MSFEKLVVLHSLCLQFFLHVHSFELPGKIDKLRIPNNELYGEYLPKVSTPFKAGETPPAASTLLKLGYSARG